MIDFLITYAIPIKMETTPPIIPKIKTMYAKGAAIESRNAPKPLPMSVKTSLKFTAM